MIDTKKYFYLSSSNIYPNLILERPWWLNSMYLRNDESNVIFVPRDFRIGKFYFRDVPLDHHVNPFEYIYIHTEKVEWGYLCALLNSPTYIKRLFGKKVRPYSMQRMTEEILLNIPLFKANEDIQNELTVIESIILSLRFEQNIPEEHKRVLSYIISVFEDLREAYILEMENTFMFSLWGISIRKYWNKMVLRVCTGDMEEDVYALFEELTQPSSVLMNNIKRLKLYASLNKI